MWNRRKFPKICHSCLRISVLQFCVLVNNIFASKKFVLAVQLRAMSCGGFHHDRQLLLCQTVRVEGSRTGVLPMLTMDKNLSDILTVGYGMAFSKSLGMKAASLVSHCRIIASNNHTANIIFATRTICNLCHRRNWTSGTVRLRNSSKILAQGPHLVPGFQCVSCQLETMGGHGEISPCNINAL